MHHLRRLLLRTHPKIPSRPKLFFCGCKDFTIRRCSYSYLSSCFRLFAHKSFSLGDREGFERTSRNVLKSSRGFTAVEFMVAVVVFGIVVVGIANAYKSLRFSYTAARQLNEMYAVLSACPEIDRALEYSSLSSSTNCYPNNVFQVEDTNSGATVQYAPTVNVTDTSALPASDPLKTVPDSKVVDLQVAYPPPNASAPPLKLRILITRNGIGQL